MKETSIFIYSQELDLVITEVEVEDGAFFSEGRNVEFLLSSKLCFV